MNPHVPGQERAPLLRVYEVFRSLSELFDEDPNVVTPVAQAVERRCGIFYEGSGSFRMGRGDEDGMLIIEHRRRLVPLPYRNLLVRRYDRCRDFHLPSPGVPRAYRAMQTEGCDPSTLKFLARDISGPIDRACGFFHEELPHFSIGRAWLDESLVFGFVDDPRPLILYRGFVPRSLA